MTRPANISRPGNGRDYDQMTRDELDAELLAERDKAALCSAQVVAAEIALRALLGQHQIAGRLISDLETGVVGRDRSERRISAIVARLERAMGEEVAG